MFRSMFGQLPSGPPPHMVLRLDRAAALYFDAPPSIWLDRGETDWPDDPLDQSPPPCPSALWLPFNRGTDRRLLRDGTHFTNSIRLKPRFMAQAAGAEAPNPPSGVPPRL